MDEDLKTETSQKEEPRSKIPGFRSGKLWKKIIAVIGYVFIGLFILALVLPSDDNGDSKTTNNTTAKGKSQIEISQTAYTTGVEQYSNNDYDSAIASLNKVIPDDPNYQDAQVKITELKTIQSANYLTNAKTNLQNKEFDLALTDLNKTLEYDPGNQEAATLKAEIPARKEAYKEQQKQQEIDNYKNSCEVISYKVLNKNPDSLKGERVKLRGEIMQIQESSGETFMLLSVTDLGYGVWSDNVAVYHEGTIDVYEDDIITIWGDVTGSFSYKSQAGWDITIPGVLAKYVTKG